MASAKTLIKGGQIKISDFIKGLADVNWSSNTLTASAAAIAAKIENEIAGVAGAMLYRGEWSEAATDTIKKGYTYVYGGNSNGSIGSGSSAVTLEAGDTLIANRDNASIADPAHWTIVQVNITGAVTEANLVDMLALYIANGNTNALEISTPTSGTNAGKLVITAKFPTISSGGAEEGKYIAGLSIDPTTGVITVRKAELIKWERKILMEEVCDGLTNGRNKEFLTKHKVFPGSNYALFINGVKQAESCDDTTLDYSFSIDITQKGKFTLSNSAYIPVEGDVVTCMYIAE